MSGKEKSKLEDIRISVIGKELIICALKNAINKDKFGLDDIEYIYHLLNSDDDLSLCLDSEQSIDSDKREIPWLNNIVERELVQLTDWILDLKKSLGAGSVNNSVLINQSCNVTNKSLELSKRLEYLLNKNGKAVESDNHVFQALRKICETYEDGALSILQTSWDINKKVISKIYEGQKFDVISENLIKQLDEINLEKRKIETELQLYSQIIDPEYQHIVDQYLNAKREIQLIDDYSSKM